MNPPTSVVITGCDSLAILEQALLRRRKLSGRWKKEDVASLLARTAAAAREGKYELYKTTHNFDGTYRNPEWLG